MHMQPVLQAGRVHAWAPPAPCMHGLAHHTAAVEQAAVVAWQESQLLAEATQGARDGGAVHAQLARDLPLTGAVLKVHAHDGLVDAWPESHGSGEGGNHIARTASQQAATGGAVPSAAGTLRSLRQNWVLQILKILKITFSSSVAQVNLWTVILS